MRLNLTMVISRLTNLTIIFSRCDKKTPPKLQMPVLYTGGREFGENRLYIAESSSLPEMPVFHGTPALISIGEPPAVYQERCEYIVISGDNISPAYLINEVQSVFLFYSDFEHTISSICLKQDPYTELGEQLYRLFRNPVSLYDSHEKLLMYSYDRDNPPYDEDYMKRVMQPGTYMPDDEYKTLHQYSEYTFHTEGASLAQSEYFTGACVYTNIRAQGQYLGRVMVDDAYRPIADADYPLLDWCADIFRALFLNRGKADFGKSKDFNDILSAVIMQHAPLPKDTERVLAEEGWSSHDTFVCTCIGGMDTRLSPVKFTGDALYLNSYFDAHHVLACEPYIIEIFNLSKSRFTFEEYKQRLQLFLKYNRDIAGVSVCFNYLGDAWYMSQQARYACTDAQRKSTSLLCFNDCVLDMMLGNIQGDYTEDFYVNDAVRALMNYDVETGSDLTKTLRCYLEHNMNYSEVQAELNVARTTALYRIRRVQELSGLNLEDKDTRLYLLLLFRLTGT